MPRPRIDLAKRTRIVTRLIHGQTIAQIMNAEHAAAQTIMTIRDEEGMEPYSRGPRPTSITPQQAIDQQSQVVERLQQRLADAELLLASLVAQNVGPDLTILN